MWGCVSALRDYFPVHSNDMPDCDTIKNDGHNEKNYGGSYKHFHHNMVLPIDIVDVTFPHNVLFWWRNQANGKNRNDHPIQNADNVLPVVLKEQITPRCFADDQIPLQTDQKGLEKRQKYTVGEQNRLDYAQESGVSQPVSKFPDGEDNKSKPDKQIAERQEEDQEMVGVLSELLVHQEYDKHQSVQAATEHPCSEHN